jgi:flagellar motor switch protein FliN/FliY
MADIPKQEDIDELMRVLGADPGKPAAASPLPLEPLSAASQARPDAGLDFLSDLDVNVRIELGTARMHVQDVLKLGSGSVVPLDSLVGDPVNVFVNDRLVARGEVLVVNENFAVRITEVIPLPKNEK